MKEYSGWSLMIKLHHFKNFKKKITLLLFIILIFSHLPLKYSKIAIILLQPLLMTYLQDLIIATIFAQNLILLFQQCVLFIVVKILYSKYYGPLILNMIPYYIKDSDAFDIFKNKIRIWKPINCPCCLCKKYTKTGFY